MPDMLLPSPAKTAKTYPPLPGWIFRQELHLFTIHCDILSSPVDNSQQIACPPTSSALPLSWLVLCVMETTSPCRYVANVLSGAMRKANTMNHPLETEHLLNAGMMAGSRRA